MERQSVHLLACLALLGLAAWGVSAETRPGTISGAPTSMTPAQAKLEPPALTPTLSLSRTMEAPLPGYDPRVEGIRWKNLTVHPVGDLSLSWCNNVTGVEKDEVSDTMLTVSPGVEMRYQPSQRVTVDGKYKFGYNMYFSAEDEHAKLPAPDDEYHPNYLTHDLNLALNIADLGTEGLNLKFVENFTHTGNPGIMETSYLPFTRLSANDVGLQLSIRRNKLGGALGYTFGLVNYLGLVNDLSKKNYDYTTHTVPLLLDYKCTERLHPYFCYMLQMLNYGEVASNAADPSYMLHDVRVGTKAVYQHFSFDFNVGMVGVTSENDSGETITIIKDDSDSGMGTRFIVGYDPQKLFKVGLAAEYRFCADPLRGGSKLLQVDLTGSINPMEKMVVDAKIGVRNQQIQADETTYNRLLIGVTGAYDLHKYARVVLGVSYGMLKNDFPEPPNPSEPSLDRDAGMITVTLGGQFKY